MSSPIVVNKRRLSAKEIAEGKVAAPQPMSKKRMVEAGLTPPVVAAPPKKERKDRKPEKKANESKIDKATGAVTKKGVAQMGVEDLMVPVVASSSSSPSTDAISGSVALRSSIADLYKLGASLGSNFKYLTGAITTSSYSSGSSAPKKQKNAVDAISTDQIWGQLSMLGAPLLQDIGVTIGKLSETYIGGGGSSQKKGTTKKSSKIEFEDDEDDIDDEDLDMLDDDEDEDGSDDEGSDLSDSDDDSLNADPELARMMSSRSGKNANKLSKKAAKAAQRKNALLAFANGDDGEDDEDEWAAEFETRRDNDGGDDDEEEGRDRKPTLSRRAERLQKKFGNNKNENNDENGDDLGDFGDDDGDVEGGFGGLYGDADGEEGEEEGDEEDGDIMAEMYGDDYDGEENRFYGEDEEDDEPHGTSDEEAEDGEMYDADEDARFQKGMFSTINDDGFDNILDDREDAFHHTNKVTTSGNVVAEEEEDEDYDGLTDFQIRQKQEQKFIRELENKRAFNADWAMTGEVEGRSRPKDSLVDEELDFEHGMKSVPVITEAVTAKLEERIKKRIFDSNFDDVVRRTTATTAGDLTNNGLAKRDTTADAEKSKASLMDLYEKDYLAKLKKMEEAAGMNDNIAEPLTEMEKDELKAIQMWKRLSQHLDALSNYYFTPKPVQEDLNVRVRAVDKAAPAISMESIGAFAISKASAIAPQDTFRPAQKSMLGNVSLEEMTPRERQALRRSKKEASATTKARVEKKQAEKKRRVEAAKSQ